MYSHLCNLLKFICKFYLNIDYICNLFKLNCTYMPQDTLELGEKYFKITF